VQDGILVGAIAVVGHPNLGDVRGATPRKERTGQKTEAGSREGGYGFNMRAKNPILPGREGKVKERSQFFDAETREKTLRGEELGEIRTRAGIEDECR
jgi:hypothetical protein